MKEPSDDHGSAARRRDPLHGVTLEQVGWEQMGRRVKIRCFTDNPSIPSSLKFLRKTPWARAEVERMYLDWGQP